MAYHVNMNLTIFSILVHATVRDNFKLMAPFTNPLEEWIKESKAQ